MSRYSPSARAWIIAVAAAAIGLVIQCWWSFPAPGAADYIALAVLALGAATAHAFPIRSIFDGASIRMTNVFIIAGTVILPPGLAPLLPALAITPDSWMRRRNPGVLTRWVFNASQTAVAAAATALWIDWMGAKWLASVADLAALLGGAAIFAVAQAVLVGVVIALNSDIPIRRADTLSVPHLLSVMQVSVLGVLAGGLWVVRPLLLGLVPPLILIAYRLTRTAHLAHLAQVDTKTGLHNYRHFEEVSEEELVRSKRQKRPLALLFADLDYLRNINNRYGHLAGDKVLLEIAGILKTSLRAGDVTARFGGEEFVALLPGTDADQATYLAERIRSAVASHPFVLEDGTTLNCTVSIGVAAYPEDADDMTALMEKADMAMYRAKQTRNAVARVRVLPPVPRLPAAKAPPKGNETGKAPRSPLATVVLWTLVVSGALVSAWSLWEVQRSGSRSLLLPLVGMAVAAEFLKVRVYEADRERMSVTFSIAVTMAAVTMGPFLAPLVSLTAALTHSLALGQRDVNKVLFNLFNPPLAALLAGWVYRVLSPGSSGFSIWHMAAGLAAVYAFHTVNSGTISIMISLHTGRRLVQVVKDSGWYSATAIFLGLTGAFLGGAHTELGLAGSLMFAVPLLVLRYTLDLYTKKSEQTIATLRSAKGDLEQAHREKEETLGQLIETFSSIIDARDNSVSGHSKHVANYAVALGEELGLTPTERAMLHAAALLHDMGKIAIPEAILHKPDRLTPDEYAVVKEHAAIGERILAEVRPLGDLARVVGEHHERFDGAGYPRGKRGTEISLAARIVTVADSLDSMLSDRVYSAGKGLKWALGEMDRCTGSQFDPDVVAALHRLVESRGPEFFFDARQPLNPERIPTGLVS